MKDNNTSNEISKYYYSYASGQMVESVFGEYVKFTDHESIINELRQEIQALKMCLRDEQQEHSDIFYEMANENNQLKEENQLLQDNADRCIDWVDKLVYEVGINAMADHYTKNQIAEMVKERITEILMQTPEK